MDSQSKDDKTIAAPAAESRCPERHGSVRWLKVAAAAFGFHSMLGCNSMLGIDEATLCGGGPCDGGITTSIEGAAPTDMQGEGAGGARPNASDASAPLGNGELRAPAGIELLPSDDSPDNSGSGNGNSGGGNNSGSGNPGNGNPGNGNPGSGNPGDGNPGNGNPGSGNPGAGGASSGGSGGEAPPPSACAGRAEGEAFCDGATRIACGAGGIVTSTLPCPTTEHCNQASGPTCALCRTGEALCSGAVLSVCNAAHTGYDAQACASPALCNAAQARCDTPACGVGEMRCDGALLQACNATLTGFDTIVDCLAPEACNVNTRSCNVCTPNARRCVDSNTAATCDASGQSEVLDECTLLVEECTDGACELIF